MRAQLRATSVTLTFGRTVWRGLKLSCTLTTSAVTSGLIGPMMTGMIFGTNRLINNFCVKLSVVSVTSYLWIAAWIAFWIASGVNQFFGIT